MDATDYLKTPEAQAQIKAARERVQVEARENPARFQNSLGQLDPLKLEQEINRQVMAVKEELMYDLPDLYLSVEEVRERRLADLEGIPKELWPDLPEGWLDGR